MVLDDVAGWLAADAHTDSDGTVVCLDLDNDRAEGCELESGGALATGHAGKAEGGRTVDAPRLAGTGVLRVARHGVGNGLRVAVDPVGVGDIVAVRALVLLVLLLGLLLVLLGLLRVAGVWVECGVFSSESVIGERIAGTNRVGANFLDAGEGACGPEGRHGRLVLA